MYLQHYLALVNDSTNVKIVSQDSHRYCEVPAGYLKNTLCKVVEILFAGVIVISESDFTSLIG